MLKDFKKILIVDDDNDLREIFSSSLELDGHTVLQATNGQVALDILLTLETAELPDCIVLDLMMPVMDGNSFLKVLSSPSGASFSKIPVIVCSGFGVYTESEQIFRKLDKPVHLETLNRTVEEAMAI